jgi:hypothetical protein
MEYSECLKLCILEGDLDSLQSFPLYIRHTLGMDKATVCINEPPNYHGQWLIEKLPLHLFLENQELFLFSIILPQDLCWLRMA